jgi:NTP pyrophosphatase (non-canonical NTP hydrolase)
MPTETKIDFTAAADRARHIRNLYKQLEERMHGSSWTPQEIMLGYQYDTGELGRLIMAAEGRWLHEGDVPKEMADKLAECLWWVLVLSDRMGVDMTKAFSAKMNELDMQLTESVERKGKVERGI